ncbi:MAG: dihydrofolate reductase [Oscillospiraceae bacterium]|nr:dihydrofolate reductase [Oscillospiraceae bacterium]
MPWNIEADLQYFRQKTMGKTIVMGRATFESLPCILPKRQHLILTRDHTFKVEHPAVKIISHLDDIAPNIEPFDENFVIGGGQIYCALLHHCEKLYITRIDKSFDADTFFPQIAEKDFKLVDISERFYDQSEGVHFTFETYEKRI